MDRSHAFFVRAVSAAIKVPSTLDAMTDYFAVAMLTFRRKRVNSAFKTIEVARYAVMNNFQRLVVFVSANFTFHTLFSSLCSS
jgi:hypothetical protein